MSLKKIIYLQSEQVFQTLVSQGYVDVEGKGRLLYEPETTDYRCKFEPEAIPVKGIQIGSVDQTPDADGKVNIPTANNSTLGVVKTGNNGISIASGVLRIEAASTAEVEAKSNAYKPIVPSTLQTAVDVGVKGSTNYKQITYYAVDDSTAHHAKLYIEEID